MANLFRSFILVLALAVPAFAEDAGNSGPDRGDDFIGDDGFGRGNQGRGRDDDAFGRGEGGRGRGRGGDDDRGRGNEGSGGDPSFPSPGPSDPFGGGFEPARPPPAFEPGVPIPNPVTPDPVAPPSGAGDPGPSFPSPTPVPGPVFESPVMNQAPVNAVQPSTVNQAPRDPAVSVYSQSSSTAWVEGDPFATSTSAAAVPETAQDQAVRSMPDSSFVWVVSGEVIAKGRGSVTIEDRRRKQTVIFADAGVLAPLRKGSMIQATLVPGSNKAKSLQKLA